MRAIFCAHLTVPFQCHFVRHKPHMNWPGIKLEPPQWEFNNYQQGMFSEVLQIKMKIWQFRSGSVVSLTGLRLKFSIH